jgi:hypothetical protein
MRKWEVIVSRALTQPTLSLKGRGSLEKYRVTFKLFSSQALAKIFLNSTVVASLPILVSMHFR